MKRKRFEWHRQTKGNKKHIYTQTRWVMGFPETGRTEIARSLIRPEEMVLLFLKRLHQQEGMEASSKVAHLNL